MQVLELQAMDLTLVGLYLALIFWIGLRARRTATASDDFLLAGRGLTLPLFVGSLVSTWYGGLLGVTEIAFTDGVAAWLTQGGFWYAAYLVFALFLAGRLASSQHTTLPDQIGALHGEGARRLATLLNYLNVVPIAYVLSLGIIVQLFSGWSLTPSVLLATAIAAAYSVVGGFRAVVYTDLLQFALMCVVVAMVLAAAVFGLGDGAYLAQRLPATHLQFTGAVSGQELSTWGLIAFSTLVDPNFYHRCYAAESPAVARRGMLLAIGFWLLFDVCTVFGGLYARAALGPDADPQLAYPLMAWQLLPPGLRGLLIVGLLATAMSTVDSYCFIGAMTLSHDVWRRHIAPESSEERVVMITRLGVFLTAALAAALALVFGGSFKSIWKTLGSLSTAAMLLPALLGLAGWRPRGAGLAGMLGGMVGTLGWASLRGLHVPWAMGVEPLLPGGALSLLAYGLRGITRRKEP
ncbi:MAG: sodium:solute symporter family protein [Deltaproteobacteria bacterium]|nr:sodium:solute symporter family protein [Deltaproteobacteria bacterium]